MKGYYLHPDIRENLVAFTSDDDVWLMTLEDMKPIRVTSGQGVAIRPKISPDGKKIAYTIIWLRKGKGGGDIFITGNGETKRITFFGSMNTRVLGWLSDDEILVLTDFHTPFPQWSEAYKININDGTMEKIPFGPISNIAISGDIIVIARGYQDLPFWKGYKGGTKGEFLISYDKGNTFNKFLSLDGIVSWPMIIKDRVYFLSDHEGVSNLYSVNLEGKDLTKHTNFTEYYCRNASSDGKRIVFQNGGDIYLYDPEKQELKLLDIDLPTDRKKKQGKFVEALDYTTEAIANDKYLSLISRGKVFLMRHWDGPAVQLGEKQGVRYKQIQLLPNGDTVVLDTNDGKLTFLSKDGSIKKLNVDLGRIERIKVSPDGKKILISNNRLELWLYEVDTTNLRLIDKSEYDVISQMDWYPDSEWFAYTFPESYSTQSIKLAHISGKVIRITSPYGYDFSPSFDPDGRYLYFLSARHLDPTNDKVIFNMSFQRVIKPYLVVLSNIYSPFNQSLEETTSDKKVEIEGIEDRVIPFPVDEDYYIRIEGAKNNKIFLFSLPIKGYRYPGETLGKLEVFDLDSKTKELYADNVKSFSLTIDKGKILILFKDSIRLLDVNTKPDLNATGKKGGIVDLSRIKVYVDPEREWKQMFREAWKLMQQNYWKPDGLKDWESLLLKYEKLIDRISTRYELSDLIQEMQGETKTSHSYEMPYDYDTAEPLPIGGLGADFEYDKENKCYKIAKIYVGDPTNENERSPLRDPGVQLNVGDCIKAVDGEEVKYNILSYLINKDQVVLDVITKDGKTKRVTVKLLKDEKFLVYRYWVEKNRQYVHEKSKGKLGYVHIPDMMYQGFAEFYRLFLSEFHREGLIVDVRFNRGGFISGLILEKLLLKRMGYVVRRNGKELPHPFFSSPGVIVAITNQYAGSDGDIFSYLFKKYKLGILIGRRTWGGVIGINVRDRLADNSAVSQPEFAVHFHDIGLKIENYGVDPDIEVDIKPEDYANGRDPQLDTAIELALKQLEEKS
ncbi:S41 family peptidase [Sulfurisphaera ohwakuensis]|uniref:Tricorn protease homolog n=1 Tax=Sulfurisphaera ohwakuensis TaxID=69656 RepID=A0A650CGH7_SULOH|nr:S41 family peptidase [Sulfurisphaera ohwakuensis]MBB5252658.1 tricorn protease [Sulfurisphaera ohwakuensis]QGR16912.1 peptidase [Sulfurisphaera ohwakuensis]